MLTSRIAGMGGFGQILLFVSGSGGSLRRSE